MQLQQSGNLEQITRRYRQQPDVEAAARLIRRSREPFLRRLLRSHLIDRPTDAERAKRRGIDELIGYYSMLEVAALAGCIAPELPRDIAAEASAVLARPSVIRYYERLYPLTLPQLLLRRLQGDATASSGSHYLFFVRFLHISDRCESAPVRTFLRMLDDYVVDGYGLTDVLKEVSSPAKLARFIGRRQKRRSALTDGVDGLLQFLGFTRELDRLLGEMEHLPVLQSAFWHYHGYWFQQLGVEMAGVLASTIESFRDSTGLGRTKNERALIHETTKNMDEAQHALRRATSGLYSAALDRIALRPTTNGETSVPTQQPLVEREARPV